MQLEKNRKKKDKNKLVRERVIEEINKTREQGDKIPISGGNKNKKKRSKKRNNKRKRKRSLKNVKYRI